MSVSHLVIAQIFIIIKFTFEFVQFFLKRFSFDLSLFPFFYSQFFDIQNIKTFDFKQLKLLLLLGGSPL